MGRGGFGVGPDGLDPLLTPERYQGYGISWYLVGVTSDGRSVWALWFADTHKSQGQPEAVIAAVLSSVRGVRYRELQPSAPRQCAIYGSPRGWPPPGPNYVLVGISGAGGMDDDGVPIDPDSPIYARWDTPPVQVSTVLSLARATRP